MSSSYPNENQYYQQSQSTNQNQKDYDQPRFYNSPMVVQQPYLQMTAAAVAASGNHPGAPPPPPPPGQGQYAMNQSIIYPLQQQYYEPIPVNNYLLIPQQNGATNLYNSNYIQHQPVAQQQVQQQQQSQQPQQSQQSQQQPQAQALVQQQSSQQTSQQTPSHQHIPQQASAQAQMRLQQNAAAVAAASTTANASPAAGAGKQATLFPGYTKRLQELLPQPPLSKAVIRPDINFATNQKRAKRKSKFSKKQDELIVSLKRKGKSWVEIAEMTQVGSYLAARNRYQVIVGQQGNNNSSSWDNDDKVLLRKLLDTAELEKWRFIANEFNKATGKHYSDKDCRDFIKSLFWINPASFQVNEETINECAKEKKITEKALEQNSKQGESSSNSRSNTPHSENQYADTLLNKPKKEQSQGKNHSMPPPTNHTTSGYSYGNNGYDSTSNNSGLTASYNQRRFY